MYPFSSTSSELNSYLARFVIDVVPLIECNLVFPASGSFLPNKFQFEIKDLQHVFEQSVDTPQVFYIDLIAILV